MSTSPRRPLARVLSDLDDFRHLILPDRTCERWEVCGSVRRQRPDVGDCDIVCIPRFEMVEDAPLLGLFPGEGLKSIHNLLWDRVDALVDLGTFGKTIKDTAAGPRTNWGSLQRSIEFRGMCWQIFVADADSWGMQLAVRTGPDPLPKILVMRLPKFGYSVKDGFHLFDMKADGALCKGVSEEQAFAKAGIDFLPPPQRDRLAEKLVAQEKARHSR